MEPATIFAASIGLVSICRLTFVAAEFLGKSFSSTRSTGKRADWYCFFKTSDLLGTRKQNNVSVPEDFLERRRRVQQQRPRLRAETNLR